MSSRCSQGTSLIKSVMQAEMHLQALACASGREQVVNMQPLQSRYKHNQVSDASRDASAGTCVRFWSGAGCQYAATAVKVQA